MKRIKKGLSVFLVFCITLMQLLWSGIFAMPAYARTGNGTLTEDSNLFNLEAENITFGENAKITFTFPEDTEGEVCLSIYDFEESLVAEGYYSLSSDMQGKVVWTPEDIPVGFYEANANIYRDNGTAPAAQKVMAENKASEPAAPSASGYTFSGWYEEACARLNSIFADESGI